MRLRCYGCGKSVSTEVPGDTLLRAVAWCPECIEAGKGIVTAEPAAVRAVAETPVRQPADALEERIEEHKQFDIVREAPDGSDAHALGITMAVSAREIRHAILFLNDTLISLQGDLRQGG